MLVFAPGLSPGTRKSPGINAGDADSSARSLIIFSFVRSTESYALP